VACGFVMKWMMALEISGHVNFPNIWRTTLTDLSNEGPDVSYKQKFGLPGGFMRERIQGDEPQLLSEAASNSNRHEPPVMIRFMLFPWSLWSA
jgi:hypothetical protein